MKELKTHLIFYLSHPMVWIMGGVLSCLTVILFHFTFQKNLHRLEIAAHQLKKREEWASHKEIAQKKLLQQLQMADRDYIEKEVESLKFLLPEIKKLHRDRAEINFTVCEEKSGSDLEDFSAGGIHINTSKEKSSRDESNFPSETVKVVFARSHSTDPQNDLLERLQYLESDQNKLRFKEQNFQSLDGYSEVEVIQDHPVEMNRDDLKNLIARIENQPIGIFQPGSHPPDLLIKKFDLLKKPMGSNEETFVINLELIKYEMVHE